MNNNSSTSRPFISIVMPVYNNERFLPAAVNSILRQSFPLWELIIIDDGSTDGTPCIADDFARTDQRIRVIHQDNQGIYKSYNIGYAAAKGEYVLIVNSDDTINPHSLKEIHDAAVIDYADIVVFNLAQFVCDAEQNIISDLTNYGSLLQTPFSYDDISKIHNIWPSLIERKLIHHQCVYRKNIYKAFSYAEQYIGDDILYNQRIARSIAVAAGTPYIVYNCYLYKNETLNASTKYYGYEHEMFNTIYYESKKLFEEWGVGTSDALGIISAERLRHLTVEIHSYLAPQCLLNTEEKIEKILTDSSDEIVYGCAERSGRVEEWESRILSGLRELLVREPLNPASSWYFVYELLDGLLRYEKDEEDLQKIRAAVYHEKNPKHIGLSFLRKLSAP